MKTDALRDIRFLIFRPYFLSAGVGIDGRYEPERTNDEPKVTTQQERIRGMGLLFVCLMALGMGHSLFFAIFPSGARSWSQRGASEHHFHTIGRLVGADEPVLGPAQRCLGAQTCHSFGASWFWHLDWRSRFASTHRSARLASAYDTVHIDDHYSQYFRSIWLRVAFGGAGIYR